MGLMGFVLTMIVFAVPVVGIMLAFVWALGKKTAQNRKDFARAQLIVWGVFLIASLVFYILNMGALNELIKVILS